MTKSFDFYGIVSIDPRARYYRSFRQIDRSRCVNNNESKLIRRMIKKWTRAINRCVRAKAKKKKRKKKNRIFNIWSTRFVIPREKICYRRRIIEIRIKKKMKNRTRHIYDITFEYPLIVHHRSEVRSVSPCSR